MSEKALQPIEQKEVIFYEDTITAVLVRAEESNEVYIPIRPVCDLLGVDWAGQRRRILRDAVLSSKLVGVDVMTTPSSDGRGGGVQTMSCLPLDYLNGWLFGINASRVRPEVKTRLIRYQEECYRVLAEAFREGRLTADATFEDLLHQDSEAVQAYKMLQALVKLARHQILIEARLDTHDSRFAGLENRMETLEAQFGDETRTVSEDQAAQISQAVKAIALVMSKQSGRNQYGSVYGELYRKFGITSYKLLPAGRFKEAMGFLTNWHGALMDSPDDVPF